MDVFAGAFFKISSEYSLQASMPKTDLERTITASDTILYFKAIDIYLHTFLYFYLHKYLYLPTPRAFLHMVTWSLGLEEGRKSDYCREGTRIVLAISFRK